MNWKECKSYIKADLKRLTNTNFMGGGKISHL